MPSPQPAELRREQARKAALTRWAKIPPSERSRRARAAFRARFERQVDPERLLAPADRAAMVDTAIKAHYAGLRYARLLKKQAADE